MYQSIIHTIYHLLQVVLVMWNVLKKYCPDFVSFLSPFEVRAGVVGHQWAVTFTVFRVAAPLALEMAPQSQPAFMTALRTGVPLRF